MADEEAQNRSANGAAEEVIAVKDGVPKEASTTEVAPSEEPKKSEVSLNIFEKFLFRCYSKPEQDAFIVEKIQKQRNKKGGNENTVANPPSQPGIQKLFQCCCRTPADKACEAEEQRTESAPAAEDKPKEADNEKKDKEPQKDADDSSTSPPADNAAAPPASEKTAEEAAESETPAADDKPSE